MVPVTRSCQHEAVQELPARAPGSALERRRGAELTPVERASRRKNRQWMGVIAVFSVILGASALVAAVVAGSGGSTVHPLEVPASYQAVSDGFFAYAVPAAWKQSSAYTDDVGDLDTQGASGWVAEHLGARSAAPLAGETPPASFATFGESRPVPYQLSTSTPALVHGAAVAYRYTLSRPGGFQAIAVDAWQASTGAEVWLLVHADAATTSAVFASLNA
jgi:hypothetical protein